MVGSIRSTFCAELAFLEKRNTKQFHTETLFGQFYFVNFSSDLGLRLSTFLHLREFRSTKTEAPEN